MSKIVSNYTANGSSTTDEYGTFIVLNRFIQGDVVEGFAVAANSTANMTVYVQPGSGRITTGTYPSSYGYLISHDTSGQGEAVTIATAAASARIDYVVAYIDKGVAGSTSGANVNNTNNVLKFASVAGTPSGSPVVPTTAQIQAAIGAANPYIILAQIAVAANVTTITNANITDKRAFISATNAPALGATSYVDSGLVWSAGSGLTASMSAGKAYINVNGAMVPVNAAAISSQTFTANQDTYVYITVLGQVLTLAVANGATSPTLPANSIWLAKIITGASTVSAVYTTALDSNGKLLRPLAVGSKQTDAAGWIVTDYGGWREYDIHAGVVGSATLVAAQSGSFGSFALPTGFSTFSQFKISMTIRTSSQSVVGAWTGQGTATTLPIWGVNTYTSSVTYNWWEADAHLKSV